MLVAQAIQRGLRLQRVGRNRWLVRFRGQSVAFGTSAPRACAALLQAALCVELCAEAGGQ